MGQLPSFQIIRPDGESEQLMQINYFITMCDDDVHHMVCWSLRREKLHLGGQEQKEKKEDDNKGNDLRRMVDEAHPPRASDIEELHGLQKTKKERDGGSIDGILPCCL